MLIDSGAIGNYVSAQECAKRKMKFEKEKNGKEMTMADGSKVSSIGRVWPNVRCGGYHRIVEAGVFPQMSKPMNTGNAMVGEGESTHQLDTLNSGGSAGTESGFHCYWRVWTRTS